MEHLANPTAARRSWPSWSSTLLNDLVRLESERLRDGQPQRLGGFEIDHQLERGRLLDREIGRLGPSGSCRRNTATRCSVSRVYSWRSAVRRRTNDTLPLPATKTWQPSRHVRAVRLVLRTEGRLQLGLLVDDDGEVEDEDPDRRVPEEDDVPEEQRLTADDRR